MPKSLYIASTQASGGKTTIATGLCLALRERGLRVGYFKPVGVASPSLETQGTAPSDEDARFVADLLELDDDPLDVSPVILDENTFHDVFATSGVDPITRIAAAFGRIRRDKDIVVCEGLGEIWQGRFLRASGADIIAQLDLAAVLIARFAGARLLDDVLYVKEALKYRLLGVLFNMVPESRLDLVREKYIPLLDESGIATYGVLANDARLAAVPLGQLAVALGATFLCGEDRADQLVETYVIGAMNPAHAIHYFEITPRKAVVVGGDRTKIILSALETPTVVVVLTGSYVPDASVLARARERGVALVSVSGDTVSAAEGLRHLFGRMRVRERTKVELAAALVEGSIDLERFLSDLED